VTIVLDGLSGACQNYFMDNDIDLAFALMALDPFGLAIPEDVDYCEFDAPLDGAQDAIRNFYFVDS
jgi:hypothetical protein